MARFTDIPVELLDLISDHFLALVGGNWATLRTLILMCRSLHQHFAPQLWADMEVITDRDIHIGAGNPTAYKEIWETIAVSLKRPRRLAVGGTDMNTATGPGRNVFWMACTWFEEIDYRGVDQTNLLDNGFINCLDFSRLSRLRCTLFNRPLRAANLLNWIGACSNLTQLHLEYDDGSTPVQDFATLAKRSAWTKLEDLSLSSVHGSDEQFAALLRHLPPLKQLTLWRAWGGPASFESLRGRHFDSLRSLDVSAFPGFVSSMTLEVLLHCPQLEECMAPRIALKDLRSSPQSWVCLGLKRLSMFFVSDPDAPGDNALLFDQLSRLGRLELLDVSQPYKSNGRGIEKSSQWRLDSGLSQLSTLTRLERFNFANTKQELREEDVEWVLEYCPRLEEIDRDLSTDRDTKARLRALVKQRGIKFA
ncbi:hypothetical protein BGX23_010964 [Mortierella sp. AD031]|nr:hypothetical protein BGX23_010964 [Mortierella sp. AD031]